MESHESHAAHGAGAAERRDPRALFFDERAATWEERCYPPAARERLAGLARGFGVKPGSCVLDMGTGTGVLIPCLREAVGDAGRILSFDVSFEMVRRAGCKEPGARGLCVQATAMRIPARDGAFDHVICFAAFPHFADKAAAVREMARVTRPGGEVVIAHLLSRAELARHHGGHPAVAQDALPDDGAMRQLLRDAGLTGASIADGPGMYVARARKPEHPAHGGAEGHASAPHGHSTHAHAVDAGFEARRVFTALKEHDVMHHAAVYGVASGLLRGAGRPLRLLDVGCGEAVDMARALSGVDVAAYTGVDTSGPALAAARQSLSGLDCPVTLVEDDYRVVLSGPEGDVDVIWMGLFLHHLPTPLKADLLRTAHRLLASGGMVLAHDPVMGEDEDRDAMLARMAARGREHWHFLTPEDVGMVHRHWSAHGHQERFSTLRALGEAAGFAVDMVWTDGERRYGLMRFAKGD
ncbi:methyltransferase domain-containing protein [Nitratidesulfovibrio sp. 1201_IL3209]|uniref:methyltransferase domain-containing protein n=1 Tax=Nitratidesulfovibrio sp. 1201_IL3209 TaxID=3084053 RepID=UPI002FD9295B